MTTPNADSVTMMTFIDNLPPDWRALVHEYGFKAVCQAREDGLELEDAQDQLWMARNARQARWLATQYVTAKTARSYDV